MCQSVSHKHLTETQSNRIAKIKVHALDISFIGKAQNEHNVRSGYTIYLKLITSTLNLKFLVLLTVKIVLNYKHQLQC
jgi:hypothetical protein